MKGLVMKDILLLKFTNLYILIVGIAVGFIGTIVDNIIKSKLIYGYGIFLMVYIFAMVSVQPNVKSKSDIIINSFPLVRNDVVRGRYLTTILYMASSAGVVFITSNISISIFAKVSVGSAMTIFDIVSITGLSLIFLSFYLAYQYYNIGKLESFTPMLLIILSLGPNLVVRYAPKIESIKWINKLVEIDLDSITFILLGLGIILYLISIQLSKQIYKGKEF